MSKSQWVRPDKKYKTYIIEYDEVTTKRVQIFIEADNMQQALQFAQSKLPQPLIEKYEAPRSISMVKNPTVAINLLVYEGCGHYIPQSSTALHIINEMDTPKIKELENEWLAGILNPKH